jgi:hypothetical protein
VLKQYGHVKALQKGSISRLAYEIFESSSQERSQLLFITRRESRVAASHSDYIMLYLNLNFLRLNEKIYYVK